MDAPDRLSESSKPGRISELMSAFEDEPLADVIDRLIWNGRRLDATAFERYAAREMEAADAPRLRRISAQYPLRGMRLDNGSAWIAVPDGMPAEDRAVVHAVEAALTRLFVADAVACSLDDGQGLLTTLTDADLGEMDPLILGGWRERMRLARRQADLDVDRYGQCGDDGDWGAMLRCCAISESTVLPLHYEYRCDFDRASGTMGIVFQAPEAGQFSRYVYDGCGGWSLLSDERRAARASAYTLLLAGVVAQIGFSAHAATRTVWVTAYADSAQRMDRPVVSLAVDRASFDACVAPQYAAGLDDAVVDGDAAGALRVLLAAGACSVRLDALTGELDVIQPLPLPQPLLDGRIPLWRDNRALPANLQRRLHALNVRSLDTEHDDGVVTYGQIARIEQENRDSPLIMEAELESAIARIESTMPDDGKQPLFCEHAHERAAVGMLFAPPSTIYRRVPKSLYYAHLMLANLYAKEGCADAALRHAHALVELAPLTAASYSTLALVVWRTTRDADAAIHAFRTGLAHAVTMRDRSLLYLHLGYLLADVGRSALALACVQCGIDGDLPYDEIDDAIGIFLRLRARLGREQPFDDDERAQLLGAQDLDIDETSKAWMFARGAAEELADSGFKYAAGASMIADNDLMRALSASLRYGMLKPRMVEQDARGRRTRS